MMTFDCPMYEMFCMVTYSAEIQVSKQDTSDESDDPISLSISLIHCSLMCNLLYYKKM